MTTFKTHFKGLFALVRHTAPPASGQGSSSTAEPMTLLFPTDTGGLPGFLARKAAGHGGGHSGGGHGAHEPILYVPDGLVPNLPGDFPLRKSHQQGEPGYVGFSLKGWLLRLPMHAQQGNVTHDADDPFPYPPAEPAPDKACDLVGPNAKWSPLTRLATLNHVTGSTLAVDMKKPDPAAIDAVVRLSGGRIECVRSYKPLRDAFFEFFTDTETKAVQPAAEDVVFSTEATGGEITIGFSPVQLPGTVLQQKLTLTGDTTLVITSLPPRGAPKPTNLNHFFNYYAIMDGGEAPFLRVLGRCDDKRTPPAFVHTMPGIHRTDFTNYELPKVRTDENCSCLTAQVYTDQPAN